MHARSANIASSVEFGLPSEIVTAVEIVDDRLTGLYRSQVLHQAKTPPKGNFSSSRLLTKAPSDHSNRHWRKEEVGDGLRPLEKGCPVIHTSGGNSGWGARRVSLLPIF
ncbi:hypothetical protein AVEN_210991-1 [Araneus ventricosus]|uniref:Uncharacterized protein n=1 Tax=Araneus ventricosus TaxID=182803 RepID=A0A4Y2VY60_ARAVE|nr:hypothetical protein AVEN_210991-1 [Araneus ventricosus]